jgi:uncharacterized protein YecE (DUF72 family)
VKIPHALTHQGQLNGESEDLETFLATVRGLGSKLGVLLVQLPPSLEFDLTATSGFFAALQRGSHARLACEPRHVSWACESAEALLVRLDICRVASDPPPFPHADEPAGARTTTYYRLHGSPRIYYSSYGMERIQTLADQLTRAAEAGSEVWCIFDNTAHGHALENALTLADFTAPSARNRIGDG